MDFSVDVKQQELIALAKTIAEKEIAPRALRIDKSGVMDEELLEILKESGMTQLSVPKEYGGAGIDLLTGALISEQLSKDVPVLLQFVQQILWRHSLFFLRGVICRRGIYLTV